MFKLVFMVSVAALAACPGASLAQAEKAALPNLAGNYRCTPNPTPCPQDAISFTVTQSGNRLEFKSDKGLPGAGTITSPITISIASPWSMLGIIRSEGQIDWSNGTIWQKQ